MAGQQRTLSLAHLTLLDVAPPDLVRIAAQAGYDAVGIRVKAAHPNEEAWPMLGDSDMLRATEASLRSEGIEVLDVEVIRMGPNIEPADYLPLLEAGVRLGAGFVVVVNDDPTLERAADHFAQLCDTALTFEIRPVIEPMAYTQARNLAEAFQIASGDPGHRGGLLIDALHFQRLGGRPQDLSAFDASWFPYMQACDAPLVMPADFERPGRLPRGQSTDVAPIAMEGRAFRLLPGEGALPLVQLLEALPAQIPISVEAPCYPLQQTLTPLDLAVRAAIGSRRLIADADAGDSRRG
jgi:sugar phosphate isomerase/epimerase